MIQGSPMSTADPLLEARAVLLPRGPCAVFDGDPCVCYAREGACPHTDPRVTVDHLRAALAEVDRLTRCVTDLERQLDATTAVVPLTTGSRP